MDTLHQRAIAYALGELISEEREAFAREAATDPAAARALADANRLLANLRSPDLRSALFAVPDGVRARLKSLVPFPSTSPTTLASGAAAVIERLLSLVFDSDAQPSLAGGFRGATELRRLRFEAESVAVEVIVTQPDDIASLPASNSRRIMGSVEGLPPGASVLLESAATDSRFLLSTDLDGFFEASLPAGTWSIAVASGDSLFRISSLTLGS